MSTNYDPQYPPPPGQGYYGAQPKSSRRGHRRSLERSISPKGNNHDAGVPPLDPRQESEAARDDVVADNQLAPYDEEKAFAEWNRAYGPEATRTAAPAPAPAPEPVPVPVPQRTKKPKSRSSIERERRRYEADLERDWSLDRRSSPRHRRRRDSTHSISDDQEKPEAKDLGPTLAGSAAGAFLGRKLVGKNALGMVGGALAGAIGVNAGEHLDDRKRRKSQPREDKDREEDERELRYREDSRRRSLRSYDRRDSIGRERDDEMLPPRRRHADRPHRPKAKRYVGVSPDR